jgi:hypothetical protein
MPISMLSQELGLNIALNHSNSDAAKHEINDSLELALSSLREALQEGGELDPLHLALYNALFPHSEGTDWKTVLTCLFSP